MCKSDLDYVQLFEFLSLKMDEMHVIIVNGNLLDAYVYEHIAM